MDPNILWFREIRKKDIAVVGGKAANLGEMHSQNFPVPPGFVVTSTAYFNFLKEKGIKEEIERKIDAIDVENTAELEEVTEEVRELIKRTDMSEELKNDIKKAYLKLGERQIAWLTESNEEFVAVRSSATAEDLPEASFAGQQETFLNVKGKEEVVKAVKNCWASLFTARATYYRKKQGFKTKQVGIAVVVQKMVDSSVSGVMFTASPTGDDTKIVIEAGFGLGEAIVSGSITPDTYIVEKGSLKLLDKKISRQEWKIVREGKQNKKVPLSASQGMKQKIPDKTIIDLAKIGKQIEQHYKMPQDIEWAIENKEIFIVQSRAITTLDLKKKAKGREQKKDLLKKLESREIARGLGASPGIVFGNATVVLSAKDADTVEGNRVLVTKMTNPDWVPIMKKSLAIVTDEGGTTCHAAIVSRELGIPCVVGTMDATKKIQDNQVVTVNGFDGIVYEGKVELALPEKEKLEEIIDERELSEIKNALEQKGKVEEKLEERQLKSEKEKIIELLEEMAVKVKVNVALPEAAENAAKTNADGVGLLRAEHMITASGKHPAEFIREGKQDELVEVVKKGIRSVAEQFKGKPVWYRTFDARTDEFRDLIGGDKEPEEDNPMLGWHGIRRDLDEPEMLKAQFKAVKELHEEGFSNVGIMLPFVQSVEELKKAKEIAKEVGLEPESKELDFGVMVETPAAVWSIDELIKEGLDFVSFGTNDLTQLTLGIDRNNEKIQKWFNELHPAILRQLKYVIEKCKKTNVQTSICGQAASNPEMVRQLVRYGIDSVSANIDAVEKIKHVVLIEEKKILLESGK